MTDLPFEQWHPDAQRQCGFWWDLSPIACGQCERCRKEQRGHPVAPPTPQEPSGAQLALADIEMAYSETEVALAQVVSRNDKELFFNGDKALRAHLQKNLDYYRIRRDGVRALLTPQEPSEPQVDVVRLLRQCQDISHILGEVGCQAMPLVDGVRWLVDKQTALRVENTRLREALEEISRELPCKTPCRPLQPNCETCGAHRGGYWCAGCVASAALTPHQGQSTDGETR